MDSPRDSVLFLPLGPGLLLAGVAGVVTFLFTTGQPFAGGELLVLSGIAAAAGARWRRTDDGRRSSDD